MTYRVGRAWFGMSRATGDLILGIHTGEWMGDLLSSIYIYLVGFSLLAALVTGATYFWRRSGGGGIRRSHRVMGMIFLLPLLITAVTGMLNEAGETWLHLSEPSLKLLMSLHEGRWLGKVGKVYYVIVVGSALLGIGIMGLALWRSRKKAR